MNMDMMGGLGWLGMGLMWLWALLPVTLVVGVAWLIARGAGGRDGGHQSEEVAALLRRRLAAGELDIEQYELARAALGLSDGANESGSTQ